ncbi:MAG: RnfABCDGE type electron transport complex subunit D [Lachnospiraceae bacterium]
MNELIHGISGPHIKHPMTTQKIMGILILSLLPPGIFGVFHFGLSCALLIAVTTVSAVLTEFLYEKLLKKQVRISDGRMIITGLLLAYSLPPDIPYWMGALGGVLAASSVFICLSFFERNLLNPVIVSRLILSGIFAEQMNRYILNGISMATPLNALKNGEAVDTFQMILGNISGTIGETSALILCLCGVVLILAGIIDYRVSLTCLITFAAFLAVFSGEGLSSYYLTAHLAGGGFMLVVWYIAPAYSNLPMTKKGRIVYGILLGVLSGAFRLYGVSPEGICAAVLIANLCVPAIDKITIPTPFGVR